MGDRLPDETAVERLELGKIDSMRASTTFTSSFWSIYRMSTCNSVTKKPGVVNHVTFNNFTAFQAFQEASKA
jgi:hypothetical protein